MELFKPSANTLDSHVTHQSVVQLISDIEKCGLWEENCIENQNHCSNIAVSQALLSLLGVNCIELT